MTRQSLGILRASRVSAVSTDGFGSGSGALLQLWGGRDYGKQVQEAPRRWRSNNIVRP